MDRFHRSGNQQIQIQVDHDPAAMLPLAHPQVDLIER